MSISAPIRRLRRTETLPITKTTTSTDGGGEIIKKAKKKRAGSFFCFGPPPTDEIEDYYDEKDRPRKESPDVDQTRKKKKRLAKIVRSISINSSASRSKSTKDPSRLTSRKASDSSEKPLASESFRKNSDAQIFSSSSTSLSSSFSSSSSCSSVASSMAAAAAVLPKLQRKKSFLPPPGPSNHGYVTGLTLVLLSLIVMVFCGRLIAILWTATWLCLLPRRQTAAQRLPEFAAAVLPKLQRKKSFLPSPGPSNHGYVTGLTLVLLSLIVMVFCGRLIAILWTATWLCLLPRRQFAAAQRLPEFAAAERRRKGDCCGEAEKKRVVMEGFLQRNRKGV